MGRLNTDDMSQSLVVPDSNYAHAGYSTVPDAKLNSNLVYVADEAANIEGGGVFVYPAAGPELHLKNGEFHTVDKAFAYEKKSGGSSDAIWASKLVFGASEDIESVKNGLSLQLGQQLIRNPALDATTPAELLARLEEDKRKEFCVGAVSKNANSFGLAGHVLVARDGTAFEAGRSIAASNKLEVGDTLVLQKSQDGFFSFAEHSFEIPRALPKCPPEVVKEMWDKVPVPLSAKSGSTPAGPGQSLGSK